MNFNKWLTCTWNLGAIKISGKASVTTYNKSDITNFSVKDGLNSTLIIDFLYRGEPISFYTHKNTGYRIAYSAENLKKLEMDSWRGYLRKTEWTRSALNNKKKIHTFFILNKAECGTNLTINFATDSRINVSQKGSILFDVGELRQHLFLYKKI